MEWKRKNRNKCGPFTQPSQYLLLYSLNIVFSCIIKFYSTVKVLLIDTIRIKVRRRSGAEQQRVSLHCCPSQIKPFHAHEMAVRKISTYTGMVLFTLLRSFFFAPQASSRCTYERHTALCYSHGQLCQLLTRVIMYSLSLC